MTPEAFTPEEVAALKKLVRRDIAFDKCVAGYMEAHPNDDEKIARQVLALTFQHEE